MPHGRKMFNSTFCHEYNLGRHQIIELSAISKFLVDLWKCFVFYMSSC